MPELLFTLGVIATIGMTIIPCFQPTRLRALFSWLGQWMASGTFLYVQKEFFPEWSPPTWSTSIVWWVLSWVFFGAGLCIALSKPTKHPVLPS